MQIALFELLGGIVILVCTCISNSVGMLGAEFSLVAIKAFFNFSHKEGVILMQPTMLLAAAARFLLVFWERSENHHNQRVVDVKFASVMVPLVFLGDALGEILHAVISRVVETTIFMMLLAYFAIA